MPTDMPMDAGCHGPQHQMNRFLETCLLLLLAQGNAHGYALLEKLPAFGFAAETLNVSTLYRALRKMESEALVASGWEAGTQGPPRRVYVLTEAGQTHLCRWIDVIRERRSRMDRLINAYERQISSGGQPVCPEKRQQK